MIQIEPIDISFIPNNLGRIEFAADVQTENRLSLETVFFKLDTGSDFTTLSCADLENLGYEKDFLEKCPPHDENASTAENEFNLPLQYISNISIKFGDREIQGCRVFFALGTKLRSLLGSDILKYFNTEINQEKGKLTLVERENPPELSQGETQVHIYSLS